MTSTSDPAVLERCTGAVHPPGMALFVRTDDGDIRVRVAAARAGELLEAQPGWVWL